MQCLVFMMDQKLYFSFIRPQNLFALDHGSITNASGDLISFLYQWVSAWTDEEHGQQLVYAESPISPEACNLQSAHMCLGGLCLL